MPKVNKDQDVRNEYQKLIKLLLEKEMTITTMESATGGLISSLITDSDGAATVIKGAFVTYCNDAKISRGVPAEIINKFTVYSVETACAMAEVCRKEYNADIGIGITGTLGDVDTTNPQKSLPGHIYFAFSFITGESKGYFRHIPEQTARSAYKLAVAKDIVEKLLEILDDNKK